MLAKPEPQGERDLRQRVATGSNDPGDYRDLARLEYRAGHHEQAQQLYRAAINITSNNLERSELLGEFAWHLYELSGVRDEALILAEKAVLNLVNEPPSGRASFVRGFSQTLIAHCRWFVDPEAGRQAALVALDSLDQAVREDPKDEAASSYSLIGRVEMLLGNPERAIEACKQGLKSRCEEGDCLITLGRAYRQTGQLSNAENTLRMALQLEDLDPGPIPYFELAIVQREQRHLTEARRTFEQALEALFAMREACRDPGLLHSILMGLGECHFENGSYKEALAAFEKLLCSRSPESAEIRGTILSWVAECHMQLRDYSSARATFTDILNLPETSEDERVRVRARLLCAEAELLYDAGKYQQASAVYEQVLQIEPSEDARCNILLWLGEYARHRREYADARKWYEQVLSANASEQQRDTAERGLAAMPNPTTQHLQ